MILDAFKRDDERIARGECEIIVQIWRKAEARDWNVTAVEDWPA